jgi:hypothetical protein
MSTTTAYIALAWVFTFGAIGGYAVAIVRRGRKLSKIVETDRRRWM